MTRGKKERYNSLHIDGFFFFFLTAARGVVVGEGWKWEGPEYPVPEQAEGPMRMQQGRVRLTAAAWLK